MLGPNLLCILAIVFLSATVTKATINNTGTLTIITSITDVYIGKDNMVLIIKHIISDQKKKRRMLTSKFFFDNDID